MSGTELKRQAHREPLRKDRGPQRRWPVFLCGPQFPQWHYCLMGVQANEGNELINDQV